MLCIGALSQAGPPPAVYQLQVLSWASLQSHSASNFYFYARRAHLIPVEGVKKKSCNLCDRCTSGTPLTFEACECDKGAAVRLYVCRCFQSVACTIRNPFFLYFLLLPTSAPSKKTVSLFCWGICRTSCDAGQFGVSLCECSTCLCSLSWLGLSPSLFFTALSRCSTSSLITRHTARKGLKAPSTSRQKCLSDFFCIICLPPSNFG